jgi:hypothetical protein
LAYRLDKFNGTVLVVLEDGSLDTTTDLRFIGKNYAGYGEVQNENFLHLLENFANNFAPSRPVAGQIWFDSSSVFKKLKVYDGSQWKTAGSASASTTPPGGLSTGDFWFDTINQQLYTWNGTAYVLIGPELTPELTETDTEKQLVKDIFNNNHYILKFKVDNKVVAIISKDEFVLSSVVNPIQGFNRVKKGFTLIDTDGNTGVTASDHYYWGTTSNSVRFNGRPVTDFVLKDEANKFLDEGFTVGDNNDLRVWIENGDSPVIQGQNPIPSLSTLTLRVVSQTGNKDVAVIDANGMFPGVTDVYELGTLSSKWAKVYSTEFIGNLTGPSTGSHKGNVLDNADNIRFNATTGIFIGNVTGNVTGNLSGNSTGTHKGNLLDNSDVVRFNAAQGKFFGDFEGGNLVGTLTGNTIGAHRGNIVSNDGTTRFNASTASFNGEFSGIFSGAFTGNLNGLSTNVTGIVAVQNGGTGFVQYDDGQILIGDGIGLGKGNITGVSPIEVVRTSGGIRIGYVGGVGSVSSVGIIAGTGIVVSGSPVTSSGNITVTNNGVTSLSAGSGMTISGSTGSITVTNNGVTQIVAGSNVTISPTNGTGIVTINAVVPSGGGSAVNRIIAGSNITVSPVNGQGDVTISAAGGGGGGGGDMVLSATQTVTGQKTFTGGIISQAYNFTSSGNSIFYVSSPAKAVEVAVDNFLGVHYFYKTRYVVNGSADGLPGEQAPGGVIVGVDSGFSGGSGVAGVHNNAQPGIGVGVLATAQNPGFTGAVFQGVATRSKSSSFIGLRLYASAGADPYFVVSGNGNVAFDGVVTGAADYAEYFEWIDGNPNNEDRVGMTVSLVDDKIKIAESGENVIGVVSAVPAIAGDGHQLEWQGKYLRDEFGRYVYENYFYYEWNDEDGRLQSEPSYGDLSKIPESAVKKETDGFGNPLTRQVYNPHYDATETYIPRSARKEWSAIGLLGKLRILKGQLVPNHWIKLRIITENIEEWLVK